MRAREDGAALRVSREGVARWREYEEGFALAKRLSSREGFVEEVVLPTIKMVLDDMVRDLEILRRFYGVSYNPYRKELVTVEPELAPRTRREMMVMEYTRYRVERASYLWVLLRAGKILAERRGEDEEEFLRKAYLAWIEAAPVYAGSFALRCGQADMKRGAWLGLANWLAADPEIEQRTVGALKAENATLAEALPAAAILAFDEWRTGEPLRRGKRTAGGRLMTSFVSRAQRHVAPRLKKVADVEPDILPDGQDLFELAERALLPRMIDAGRPSEQEREVFELSGTLMNKEIAEELGRSENQVAQEKFRAIRKIRRAAGL
jgi:hypothetical protein